jgi:hypothetical protein
LPSLYPATAHRDDVSHGLALVLLGSAARVPRRWSRSGSIRNAEIIALSPDEALQHGRDSFIIEFPEAANGELVGGRGPRTISIASTPDRA